MNKPTKPTKSIIDVLIPYLLAAQRRRPVYVRGVAVVPKGRPVATVRRASAMRGTV